MATTSRALFPELPPELRNEVYNYLSTMETNASTSLVGLPLKLKTYKCKHTTVQICPVHHGSPGLLALQSYQFEEAREYKSWLLNNAIELKIGVTFKGIVNTFVQQDWDKKIEAHLQKLAKSHPWLRKVAKYDIQFLWDPKYSEMKSKNNKKVAGHMSRAMTVALTTLMGDATKKRKRGDLCVMLRLTPGAAAELRMTNIPFGFAKFLATAGLEERSFRSETWEVWVEGFRKRASTEPPSASAVVPVPPTTREEESLLVVDKGVVKWACDMTAVLVIRKRLVEGKEAMLKVGGLPKDESGFLDYMVEWLLRECLARG